jgi:hypothetical protein
MRLQFVFRVRLPYLFIQRALQALSEEDIETDKRLRDVDVIVHYEVTIHIIPLFVAAT